MRVLVTGADGHIGTELCPRLREAGFQVAQGVLPCRFHLGCWGRDLVPLDVTSAESVEAAMALAKPDAVVHLAGIKDVVACERNPEVARLVNGYGTGLVASSATRSGAFMVYLSTDYVFDGDRGNYCESDIPKPSTAYGKSKLYGEQLAVRTTGNQNIAIVRSAAVYGIDSCFPTVVLNHIRHGWSIDVFRDIYNSPTSIALLARGLIRILRDRKAGLFHIAGQNRLSRFEWACKVADVVGGGHDLLRPVPYEQKLDGFCRPRDLSLCCDRTPAQLGLGREETDEDRLLLAWSAAEARTRS